MLHIKPRNLDKLSSRLEITYYSWLPRYGGGGDISKGRARSVWIHLYCTVPEGVRVTIKLNTSIYTPAVCVRLSPLEVVAIVADPGALGCSCCERSLLGDADGCPSLGLQGRSCCERSLLGDVDGGPSLGTLGRSCRERSLLGGVDGNPSLGALGRSCRERSLLGKLLGAGIVEHPGDVFDELPGEGLGKLLGAGLVEHPGEVLGELPGEGLGELLGAGLVEHPGEVLGELPGEGLIPASS